MRRVGLYLPYGPDNRAEFNHFEPTNAKLVVAEVPSLRRMITADGPKDVEKMWKVAEAVMVPIGLVAAVEPEHNRHVRHAYAHHRHMRMARS